MPESNPFEDIWPVHLRPEKDELLSSWLIRTAIGHGLGPEVFFSLALPANFKIITHIDETTDYEFLWFLVSKARVSLGLLEDATFKEYQRTFLPQHQSPLRYPGHMPFAWLRPINYHNSTQLFGSQCCPSCLSEDKVPYSRRKWRLAFVTHCEKHHILLIDRCPQCDSPINFRKNTVKTKRPGSVSSITECYLCNVAIETTTPRTSRRAQVSVDDIKFQELLLKTLSETVFVKNRWESISSYTFFDTLHMVVRILAFGDLGKALRRNIGKRYKISTGTVNQPEFKCFELLKVKERLELLGMANRLIQLWLDDLVSFQLYLPKASLDIE